MSTGLRRGIAPPPEHLASRPIVRGYPLPYFVAQVAGEEPDFRLADPLKFKRCLDLGLCWVCGKPLGSHRVFIIGPMCVVNRTTSEPPSHRDCAEYSARFCPHLIHPNAKRREADRHPDSKSPPGIAVLANPGVSVLWESKTYSTYKVPNGVLIDIGEPITVEWWTEGHKATRSEVIEGFSASVERLKQLTAEAYANDTYTRDEAMLELGKQTGEAMRFLPPD